MKAFRFLFVMALLGFAVTIARADTVDPKITIGGGGSCAGNSLTSTTQSFTGLSTGCQIDFTNNIGSDDEFGVTLFKIVVNVTSGFTGALSCGTFEGSIFTVDLEASTANSCTFVTDTGFASGNVLSLEFDNDPSGGGGFNNNSVDVTLAQTVINTPEPASALLLLTGMGALAAFRKRRQAQA
jgi:hypothetical protein